MIYLALGSNLGNRFKNLRVAIAQLSEFFDCRKSSIVIETDAILPPNASRDWNLPYLNMIIGGNSNLDPFSFLKRIKNIEEQMERDITAPIWSPRIIDIDIIDYNNEIINTERLSVPHKEIKNRDFLQYLLESVAYKIPKNIKNDTNCYKALNYFVLSPKLVGVVNVTPDSFSDGGKYFDQNAAINRITDLYNEGACVIELGAQSTHPGYKEISPPEEIARLSEILERTKNIDCLGVDSYFDSVVEYAIKIHNIKWINDIKSQLSVNAIKLIADNDAKLVVMLYGMDIAWLKNRALYLQNLGIKKENILLDPGIGFAKTRTENIEIIRNISRIKNMGYNVLFAHSRKSFISSFSNAVAAERDMETIAVSNFAVQEKMDYLRVHNVRDHMRFFVASSAFK
ncbi:MAG: dihydropteroate synthase [Holosporaceae bacterium]|jgi:2-amino-4-hydroxy-6-hydroxymethyldihydropteridine diphosphokinase/dihydropteroate synthase|nr:dihydropteroate synthase [Holosporaceae bacterium]